MKKSLCVFGLSFVLFGCVAESDPSRNQNQNASWVEIASDKRIKVTRIDVMYDDISYNGKRGVYVITDTKTGKEYFGISGVGISEIGRHSSGKTRIADERY